MVDQNQGIKEVDIERLFQEFIKILQTERDLKDQMEQERRDTQETLKEIFQCLNTVKLDLRELKTEQNAFRMTWKDKVNSCNERHADFEERIRQIPEIPSTKRIETLTGKMRTVESKIGSLNKLTTDLGILDDKLDKLFLKVYTIIGGIMVVSVILSPLLAAAYSYISKKMGG